RVAHAPDRPHDGGFLLERPLHGEDLVVGHEGELGRDRDRGRGSATDHDGRCDDDDRGRASHLPPGVPPIRTNHLGSLRMVETVRARASDSWDLFVNPPTMIPRPATTRMRARISAGPTGSPRTRPLVNSPTMGTPRVPIAATGAGSIPTIRN